MKKNLLNKNAKVEEILSKLEASKSLVVFDYKGLDVATLESLRNILRLKGSELKVYKNTLAKIGLSKLVKTDGFDKSLMGQSIFMFNYDDAFVPIKELKKFLTGKEIKLDVIKAGVLEKKFINNKEVLELANIPGFEGLVSMFLSCLQAPLRNLAYSLDQVAKSKELN